MYVKEKMMMMMEVVMKTKKKKMHSWWKSDKKVLLLLSEDFEQNFTGVHSAILNEYSSTSEINQKSDIYNCYDAMSECNFDNDEEVYETEDCVYVEDKETESQDSNLMSLT